MKLLADLKVGKQESDFLFPSECGAFIDLDKFGADIWLPVAEGDWHERNAVSRPETFLRLATHR
jgi:hypothetical protein